MLRGNYFEVLSDLSHEVFLTQTQSSIQFPNGVKQGDVAADSNSLGAH